MMYLWEIEMYCVDVCAGDVFYLSKIFGETILIQYISPLSVN